MSFTLKKHFIVLFALVLFLPQVSVAENMSIAVVDVEKILNESKAGKSIQKQLNDRRSIFQKEFSKHENKLMSADKTLVKQKKELSAEAFTKKRKTFEKQLSETRRLFKKRRNSLDKGLGNALTQLRKNIIQVTAEIADENKYQVVLTRDSVVIVQKEMDITKQVLSRLDKKIKKINLDVTQ